MRHKFKLGSWLSTRHLRSGALAALLSGGWAAVYGVGPSSTFAIHQAAQPLAESLLAIARQTGASLIFDPVAVRDLRARPVSGQYSAAEAISQALRGTGLVLNVMGDGSLVVRAATPASSSSSPSAASGGQAQLAPVRVAQAPAQGATDAGPGGSVEPAAAAQPVQTTVQTVEITGSRLRRIAAESALPVQVHTREDIERSGQPTLERYLAGLNEASMTQGEGSFSPATQGQGTVQLRGLPLGSTLVLINGRRVQAVGSSSANFFNLGLIPLAAVERVEVVPVGSSAVYGGDALAGVVNVILKKSIDGHSFSAQVASGRGFGDGGVSLGLGRSGERGAWLLLGSYSKATPLTTDERAFFRDADYRRFGGPDARVRNCSPGTVSSATAANLPGLNSTFAGVPVTAPGQALSVQSFVPTAGQANLCNGLSSNGASALFHGNEALAIHSSAEYRWTEGLTGFGELTYVQDKVRTQGLGLNLNNILVPATNAYNPFGVPVRVTARLGPENGTEGYTRNTDFSRVLLGVRGGLGSQWDFEATASVSRDAGDRLLTNGTANAAARTEALAASDPALALNPFATGQAASDAVLRRIWSDSTRLNVGRRDIVGGFVRGPLYEMPAGAVDTIVGVEFTRDRYDVLLPDTHILNGRQATAAYGELRLPLWRGHAESGPAWTKAALTLAGRHDRYSDFGSAGTYQAGLELRPTRSLLLRASSATSFKPPTLVQNQVDERSYPLEFAGMVDPARGNEPVLSGEWVRTTNHDLQPEKGRALALGVLWEPEAQAGLRLGMTAWQVRIEDLIAVLSSQVVLDNEGLFPGWVTREPTVGGVPGRVTRVIWAESNFGFVEARGMDFEASHSWKGPAGRWSLGASATRTSRYAVVIAPGAPVEQHVGRRFDAYWAPEWKARVSAGLDQGVWSLGLTSRYVHAYKDMGTSTRTLGDTWVHDLSARLNLVRLGANLGAARAATLSLSVVNLGNKLPQFADMSPYFDTSQGDWRGRYASLRLSVDW